MCDLSLKINFQANNNEDFRNNFTSYTNVTKIFTGRLSSYQCQFDINFDQLEKEDLENKVIIKLYILYYIINHINLLY